MEMFPLPELTLEVSPQFISFYKELAYSHLEEKSSKIEIGVLGVDHQGKEIFGIRMLSENEEEQWYDPEGENSNTVVGWKSQDDARFILENKVLPSFGYQLQLQALQLFHQNLVHV